MQRLPSIVEWCCVETAVVVGREMVLVLLQVTAALHNSETVHIYLRLKSNMWTYGVEMHDIMPIRTQGTRLGHEVSQQEYSRLTVQYKLLCTSRIPVCHLWHMSEAPSWCALPRACPSAKILLHRDPGLAPATKRACQGPSCHFDRIEHNLGPF